MSFSKKGLRIILWLTCSVLLAFLPIGLSWASLWIHDEPYTYITLFAKGEAFLIASALTADAIGGVFRGGASKRGFRIACGVGCLIFLLASASDFGLVSADLDIHRRQMDAAAQAGKGAELLNLWRQSPYDENRVVNGSLVLLSLSILTALGVILVEES